MVSNWSWISAIPRYYSGYLSSCRAISLKIMKWWWIRLNGKSSADQKLKSRGYTRVVSDVVSQLFDSGDHHHVMVKSSPEATFPIREMCACRVTWLIRVIQTSLNIKKLNCNLLREDCRNHKEVFRKTASQLPLNCAKPLGMWLCFDFHLTWTRLRARPSKLVSRAPWYITYGRQS